MLFLTMGDMRHEALWSLWFKQASSVLPRDCMSAALCQETEGPLLLQDFTSCLRNKGGMEQLTTTTHSLLHVGDLVRAGGLGWWVAINVAIQLFSIT